MNEDVEQITITHVVFSEGIGGVRVILSNGAELGGIIDATLNSGISDVTSANITVDLVDLVKEAP